MAVHIGVLYTGWQMAVAVRPADYKKDLEGEFAPNLTNTVVFELMAAMHASSFLANYEGHPFMMPMFANKALVYALGAFVVTLFFLAAEVVPEINEELSLVAFPNENFRNSILQLLAIDIGVSVGLSRLINFIAIRLGSNAAEQHAQEWGLGMAGPDSRKKEK